MKILYVSSNHASLEYDDLKMLTEMGIDWFSTGVYLNPVSPLKSLVSRESIIKAPNSKHIDLFRAANPSYIPFENALVKVPEELAQQFDLIWVTHTFPNIESNWDSFKGKPVIWRTYNQQQPEWEAKAKVLRTKGLKIVRIGNTESNRLTFAGEDRVIRAYVDSNIFSDWKGSRRKILTYHNRFEQRLKQSLNGCPQAYLRLRGSMAPSLFELYGFSNPNNGFSHGSLPYEQQVEKYRSSLIYLSLNSESAVYTNSFMEALMTGIPVVTFGPELSNVKSRELQHSYEVPDLVENGKEAIVSDDLDFLHEQIKSLMNSREYRTSLGQAGRNKALQLFDKNRIMIEWRDFLKTI